jgi:hypothetical protein
LKVSREKKAELASRVLAVVEGTDKIVTSQFVAKSLGVNWHVVNVTLLELSLKGRISAAETSMGWMFRRKEEGPSNRSVKVSSPSAGRVVKGHAAESESVMNARVLEGLSRIYRDRLPEILVQAQGSYFYRNPSSTNQPEIYELFTNGDIDASLEALGLNAWHIGRPKISDF